MSHAPSQVPSHVPGQSPVEPLRVLLGVGGGIAAYKACEVVRRLRDAGATVRVVLTESAAQFVTPITFAALSGHPVRSSRWDEAAEAAMGHIELARWANRILIAPATAGLIARLAAGMADDLLTTLCLASTAPLAIAPAMNQAMWAHPATRDNVAQLRQRGAQILGPASGSQACGDHGPGRLLEAQALVDLLLAPSVPQQLAGVRLLVNAGPTFEDLDPVRYLGNRSSGRMGFALAAAAAQAGAKVTLIAGPVQLPTPAQVERIDVRSAAQMAQEVLSRAANVDVFIAAAAVADYTPAAPCAHKIKKTAGVLQLELEPTVDILATIGGWSKRPFLLGFAAETEALQEHARTKLEAKKLDLIAANRVGGTQDAFGADDNAIVLLDRHGATDLGRASKNELAQRLIDELARRLLATPAQ